jgi:hypothetical protein
MTATMTSFLKPTARPPLAEPMRGRVIAALAWMRDTAHHAGTWLPINAPADAKTHFELVGRERRLKLERALFEAAHPYFDQNSAPVPDRLFYPNKAGLALLHEAVGEVSAPRLAPELVAHATPPAGWLTVES